MDNFYFENPVRGYESNDQQTVPHPLDYPCLSTSIITLALWAAVGLNNAMAVSACPPGMAGEGDETDPCEITTWAQLQAIGASSARELHYKLMNHLTADMGADYDDNAGPEANGGDGWKPIEDFRGTFDGGGKTISGLYINRPDSSRVGLFGRISGGSNSSGNISNLTISDFDITGGKEVGSLAGVLSAASTGHLLISIRNVLVTDGKVTASEWPSAGFIGAATGLGPRDIVDSAVDQVDVTVATGPPGRFDYHAGFIARVQANTRIARVYFNGTIDVVGQVAGLVGAAEATTGRGNVVEDAYTIGKISTNNDNVYGVFGRGRAEVKNTYTAMSLSPGFGGNNTGGVSSSGVAPTNSFFDPVEAGIVPGTNIRGTAAAAADLKREETFTGWNFETVWQIHENNSYPYFRTGQIQDPPPKPTAVLECPAGLTTAADGACEIEDWTDLRKLNEQPFVKYRLMEDLNKDSGGYPLSWVPLRPFGGTFDGNGKTISDLNIDGETIPTEGGLFSTVSGIYAEIAGAGVVKNLGIIDASITIEGSQNDLGIMAGHLRGGVIEDSYVSGSISGAGGNRWGGLVGQMLNGAKIQRSAASVVLNAGATFRVGGLVGDAANGTVIQNTYAASTIIGTGTSRGGLVGNAGNLEITNSYSSSSFEGDVDPERRGGLTGAIGADAVTVSSYWDNDVVGVDINPEVGAGLPRTTAQMQTQGTFESWDFDSVWSISGSYPLLTKLVEQGFVEAAGAPSDPEAEAALVGGTTPPALISEYTTAGAADAVEANLSAYNDALAVLRAAATADAPLTIEAVREMVTTFNTILSAAAGNTAPALDASDYAKVGVTVPAGAVALLNNGVASADADAVNTVAKLQAIADAADRISTLANAGTGAPTAADYSAVGLADVIAGNASAYNSAVAEVKPATPAAIQAVITAYNSVLAAAGNVATAADLTAAVYSELGVTVPATALGLLNSAVGSQGAAASNTVAKLQAMSAAAAKVINTAANSQDAGLTESDFTVLGVQGVTPANVADASAAVADAAVAEVGTVPKLQALLAEVLTPPLPVPTLSLWSLLLMVMLMMGLGLRQRALRSKF